MFQVVLALIHVISVIITVEHIPVNLLRVKHKVQTALIAILMQKILCEHVSSTLMPKFPNVLVDQFSPKKLTVK